MKRLRVRLWLMAASASLFGGHSLYAQAAAGNMPSIFDTVTILVTFVTAVIGLVNSWAKRKETRDRNDQEKWIANAESKFEHRGAALEAARAVAHDVIGSFDKRYERLELRMGALERDVAEEIRDLRRHSVDAYGRFDRHLTDVTNALSQLTMKKSSNLPQQPVL